MSLSSPHPYVSTMKQLLPLYQVFVFMKDCEIALTTNNYIILATSQSNDSPEVLAIKLTYSTYKQVRTLVKLETLDWPSAYIEKKTSSDLNKEWNSFCYGISFIWYYESSCDKKLINDLLYTNCNCSWMEAKTNISKMMMTTDIKDVYKIYVKGMGLTDIQESYMYPGERSLVEHIIIDNPDKKPLVYDIQAMMNLVSIASYVALHQTSVYHKKYETKLLEKLNSYQ